jgi:hypothetical protein
MHGLELALNSTAFIRAIRPSVAKPSRHWIVRAHRSAGRAAQDF